MELFKEEKAVDSIKNDEQMIQKMTDLIEKLPSDFSNLSKS